MDNLGFYTGKGEKGEKGDTGATGAQGEKGDKGDKGDTGANGQLFNYRGALNNGETIEAKQYDSVYSNFDNKTYYKSTLGTSIVYCPPNSDFEILDNDTSTAIQQPQCLASIYILDGILSLNNQYFSGVFPINVIGSGNNIANGFSNDGSGLIKLDKDLNGKEGKYLINYDLSLAIDNIASNLGLNQGEVAILKTNPVDGNKIFNRIGTGGYYANKPALAGASSIYVNKNSSAIIDLNFGDLIGIQALNMLLTNQYKYNLAFTATYISPIKPTPVYVDNHIGIFDSSTRRFDFQNVNNGAYDMPLFFNNNIEYGYSSNMEYLTSDLPISLNPAGFNNNYKYSYYKLSGGIPIPATLSLQCSCRIEFKDVNVGNISVLFQTSQDGINWDDLTPTVINTSNFIGDKTTCLYWSNDYIPLAITNQYIRPIIRYNKTGFSLYFDVLTTSFIIMPKSSLNPLINVSTYNLGAGESGINCETSENLFNLPMMRKIENPSSPVFNGGNNTVSCIYNDINISAQNVALQKIRLSQSPNPIQTYNILGSFDIIRNADNTDVWYYQVIEGDINYSNPLVFNPLGSGIEGANVSINDNISLSGLYTNLSFNIISLGINPMSFRFSNYQLTVKAN